MLNSYTLFIISVWHGDNVQLSISTNFRIVIFNSKTILEINADIGLIKTKSHWKPLYQLNTFLPGYRGTTINGMARFVVMFRITRFAVSFPE